MADITKNAFNESLRHMSVVFQKGRNITDYELNELQDILRVFGFRSFKEGIQSNLDPGSNDDGWKIVGTGANNSVTIKAGTLFCSGIPIINESDFSQSTGATPGATATWTVYLAITEAEVTDPAVMAELGETSLRRKLNVTVNFSTTGDAGVPADSVYPIWKGGVKYFKIARIARTNGVAAINAGDVTDIRYKLPPYIVSIITEIINGKVTGNWTYTVGDGVTSFGDFNGANSIRQAIDFIDSIYTSPWTLTLDVKPGTYIVSAGSDAIIVPANGTLILRGSGIGSGINGEPGTIIRNTSASTPSISNSGHIEGHNLLFNNSGYDVAYQQNGSGTCNFSRCRFSAVRINFLNSSFDSQGLNTIVEDCVIIGPAVGHAIQVGPIAAGTTKKFLLNRCNIYSEVNNSPVLLNQTQDDSTPAIVEAVIFNDCTFILAGTNATLQNSVNNSGVVQALSNGLDTGGLVIDSLDFVNCRVHSETASGVSGIMLYLRAGDSSTSQVVFNKIRIVGGKWTVKGGITAINPPFYIGPATFSSNRTIGKVVIKDVTFGWASLNGIFSSAGYSGVPPAELSWTFGNDLFGTFTVVCGSYTIENVELFGQVHRSTTNDFFLDGGSVSKVDGLYVIGSWATGTHASSATKPKGRVVIMAPKYSGNHQHLIKNIHYAGPYIATPVESVTQDNYGVIESHYLGTGSSAETIGRITFDGCSVTRFRAESAQPGWAYRGFSTAEHPNRPYHDMIDCVSEHNDYGIRITAPNTMPRLSVRGGSYSHNWATGIYAVSDGQWGDGETLITISGARICSNGNLGMFFNAATWRDTNWFGQGPTVVNNTISGNNGTQTGVQLTWGNTSSVNPGGVFMGNNLAGAGATPGKARFLVNSGGTYAIAGLSSTAFDITESSLTDNSTMWSNVAVFTKT